MKQILEIQLESKGRGREIRTHLSCAGAVLELIVKPLAFSRQCLYLKSTKLVRKGKEKFNCLRVTLEEWISKFT